MLLFREDWAEIPFALPITQEHVANPDLQLHLYGGAVDFLKKSNHDHIPNDPYYVWSGEIRDTAIWAATFSYKDRTVIDLSGEASISWRTRQSGEHCLRVVLRLVDGDWLISEPVVCQSAEWQVTTHTLSTLSWSGLGADELDFSKAAPVTDPDLTSVVEVGFTDMKAAAGSPSSSRVDWLEVRGSPAQLSWYSPYPEIDGWRTVPWIGRVSVGLHPWIFHEQMSWIQVIEGQDGSFAIWDPALGWMWTAEGWFPYLYAYGKASWLYFLTGPIPRWFFNLNQGEWELF